MTPVALAVARWPVRPPSQVTFLPAFWMLVPGALGMIGVTELVSNVSSLGASDLVEPVASIIAIALAVLCGVSLYRAGAHGAARIPALHRVISTTSKQRQ